MIPLAALGLALAVPFLVRAGRDGLAFAATALTIVLITSTLFLNLYPRVLVSSTNKAFDLTIWSTSSTHYTLVVMTVVALLLTPVVLLYQGWTYYVFRHRDRHATTSTPLKSPIELLSRDARRPDRRRSTTGRMRPVDPRLLRVSPAARTFLVACVPLGLSPRSRSSSRRPCSAASSTMSSSVIAASRASPTPLALLAASGRSRAGCSRGRSRPAATSRRARPRRLRRRLVRHSLGDRPGDPATTSGDVATAAVAGVDALDPYFARYLPQLVLGAVVPLVILVRVVTLDVISAVDHGC